MEELSGEGPESMNDPEDTIAKGSVDFFSLLRLIHTDNTFVFKQLAL